MEKKRLLIVTSIVSLLCAGVASFVLENSMYEDNSDFVINKHNSNENYYSLTINAEDVSNSGALSSGSYVAHTDQLNNPVTFNCEDITYEQDGENKYLVFGEEAWFANTNASQIKSILTVTVYGNGAAFTYRYGWTVKTGSIQYTEDHNGTANGAAINFGTDAPNYFALMTSASNLKISKIVFTYSRNCTSGIKPTLESISLSGQTTTLTRGNAFSFGGTVTAHFANGTTSNVTSLTNFSGYNMSLGGTYTVTASYTHNDITKTATYTLTVNKKWTTLWSGSREIYIRKSSGYDANVVGMGTIVSGAVHYSTSLRVSFSTTYITGITSWPTDNNNYLCGIYWGTASRATSFGSSPKSVTIKNWGSNILTLRSTFSDSGSAQVASAYWAAFSITTTSSGNIAASASKTPTWGDAKVGLRLTKIEEYY